MKLYVSAIPPNPRKVILYVKEKGLDIPQVEIDIMKGEQKTPEFLAKNPFGALPVLQLDDGSYLTESLAIMEYLEELHPENPMLGTNAQARARVRELERIADTGVLNAVAAVFQNTSPFFAKSVRQSPDVAEAGRARFTRNLAVLDAKIGDNAFVAGDKPTFADCTLFAALAFGEFAGVEAAPESKNVLRWFAAFKQRPSAS
ncbi:MAG: glutathione S-transferase family protein [Deltaproteobacteria bacterium]